MLLQRRHHIFQAINVKLKAHFTKNRIMSSSSTDAAALATTPAKKSIIAVSQMRSTNDKASNMRQVAELVARAKAQSAVCLFLPECCDFVGENRQQTLQLSEPLTGPTMQQYRDLARQHGIWLSLGGIHECDMEAATPDADSQSAKIYNAHVLLNDAGDLVSVYRKLHLFDVQTPTYRFRESDVVTPGRGLVAPVDTPFGAFGLQICYDLRFAESSLLLRKAGAQILSYPSAFTYATGEAHWELLLRARAIENQCFVIAAAQVGFHNAKRQSWGHAMVVSPWGKVLADCGGQDQELSVAAVELDCGKIAPIRAQMPCFEHRRGDVYGLTAADSQAFTRNEPPAEDRLFAEHIICKDTIFFETPHCFAFTNLRCVVSGHVLVSTKRVVPRLQALTCEEATDLFAAVCKVQGMLESIYKTTAATVTVQDGADAGQTVPHVHFHVMPRRPGDFGHNDQIYVKLEDCVDIEQPNRELSDRIEEAQKYRAYLNCSKL